MSQATASPVRSILERWLALWLCLGCLLAFYWPSLFPQLVDPFEASKPTVNYQMALIMFCIGSLLPSDALSLLVQRWRLVLAGTALQYTAMPLLAFLLAKLFALTGDAFIGVLLVGCVPGAMASNVLTLSARGDVTYSVSLTTLATLVSPLIVPLILFLSLGAAGGYEVLWGSFVLLLATVVAPVLLGYYLCRVWSLLAGWMQVLGPVVANLIILWLIAVVVALNRERIEGAEWTLIVLLFLLNVLGYLTGYFGGKLLGMSEPLRRALTIEIGMQNAGLGTTLALTLFSDRTATAIAPALFTFGCMLTGALLARWWSGRLTAPGSDG